MTVMNQTQEDKNTYRLQPAYCTSNIMVQHFQELGIETLLSQITNLL